MNVNLTDRAESTLIQCLQADISIYLNNHSPASAKINLVHLGLHLCLHLEVMIVDLCPEGMRRFVEMTIQADVPLTRIHSGELTERKFLFGVSWNLSFCV